MATMSTLNRQGPDTDEAPPGNVRDILAAYYRDAATRRALASPEEEAALSRRVQSGKAADKELANGSAECHAELEALISDGYRARRRLIEANLRLVPHVAKMIDVDGWLRGWVLGEDDMIQEGNRGLLRAAERFEWQYGVRFAGYAAWSIWSSMRQGVLDQGRLVRLPVYVAERVPMLLRAQEALAGEHGGRVSAHELAEHLGWRIEMVEFVRQGLSTPVSLDIHSEDDLATFGDRLTTPPEAGPDAIAERSEQRRRLAKTLATSLRKSEAFVVKERFGLDGGEPRTLDDISKELGVTRQRVGQLEVSALDKLRRPSMRRLLRNLFGLWHLEPIRAQRGSGGRERDDLARPTAIPQRAAGRSDIRDRKTNPFLHQTGHVFVKLSPGLIYAQYRHLHIEDARRELTELLLGAKRLDESDPFHWRRRTVAFDLDARVTYYQELVSVEEIWIVRPRSATWGRADDMTAADAPASTIVVLEAAGTAARFTNPAPAPDSGERKTWHGVSRLA